MDSSEPDGPLIAAIRAGQTHRFDELARRYSGGLWRMAYSRLRSRHLADDAVQETLLAAFRWLSSYDSRYSFRTWLWTILLNECRRLLAKQARRREVSASTSAAEGGLPGLVDDDRPHQRLLLQERAAMLERLLERLPEAEADALRLRFFGDLKFQEIADILGCSLSTAKYRVRDGLTQLGQWLSSDELSSSSAPTESGS
jgi:RNA polymerase sigma-70 factor (ECF subfamily)